MHVISPQLTVKCHKRRTTPRGIRRGSATTDAQFAYFTPRYSNLVYKYEWNTEKWEKLPPSPYRNSGLVIINGKLTAVGGGDVLSRTNKLFTLWRGKWIEQHLPMNTARFSPAVASTSDGNHIVVIGGSIGDIFTATVELFHVRHRRWYELTKSPQALSFPSATICGGQLHIIGEYGSGYSCSLQALLSSDQPITSQSTSNILTWTLLPQQPAPNSVTNSTAATLCGQLVKVGGVQFGSNIESIHQLLDGQWVEIGSMSSSRSLCLVVNPSPDKMIIVGGYGQEIHEYFFEYSAGGQEEIIEECVGTQFNKCGTM